MKKLKKHIYLLVAVVIPMVFASCTRPAGSIDQPPPVVYEPPIVQPLKLADPVKLNPDSMKTTRVYPAVKPFRLDKLPSQSYDTTGFEPFKHAFEKAALAYNSLPEKDFDLDKLPSVPVKFKTYRLPQPQIIKTESPHLKIANELAIYELGDAGGLNKSMITALFTDHKGYLWIASGKGLYRYDGDNLSLMLPVLNRNYINSILEDSNHIIWLTTAGDGLKMLDLAAGILKVAGGGQGLGGDNYYSIVQDHRKRLWLSGERLGGVVIVDLVTSTAKMLNKKNGLSSSLVNRVMAKDDHQIWVATGAGINIIDLATKKIKFLNKAAGLKSDTVDALLNDSRGRTWIASHGGHLQFLNTQKDTSYYLGDVSASAQPIIKLFEDARGRIWVLTSGGGVETIDVDRLKVRGIKKNNGLANDFSISGSQDGKGQVWIGTFTGLNMFGQNNLIKKHLGTAEVMSAIEDKKGMIWLASDKGLDIIDTVSQTIRLFTRQQGLDVDFLQGIFTVDGKVIVAGGNGFDIIDEEKRTISHCSRKQGFFNQVAIAIMADKHGVWWIGGDKGIDIFDPIKNTVRHIGKALGLSNYDGVMSLATDKLGRVWAGCTNGRIFVIDPASGTLSRLPLLDKFRNDAFSPVILMADNKGRIWVGLSTGVLIADVEDQTLSSFSAPQGLIGTPVRSLLQRGGKVYAAADEGITVIEPPNDGQAKQRKWEVSKFGSSYGINKVTSSDLLMTDQITHDGLYLLGRLGVTVLDLNRKDTSTSQACITAINISDRRQYFLSRSGYTGDNGFKWNGIDSAFNIPLNLRVPYNQNSFQFEYGVNDLSRIDTAWYRCRLVGVDGQWNPVSNEPKSKYYSNLKPGSYAFYVVTRNKNGLWSKPARFNFTINPPWWQTWWAYLLFLMLFVGIVWGFAYFRSLRLIKEKRILEIRIEERTEEVRRQKNEIEAQRDSLEKTLYNLKATQTQLIQSEKMASLGELTAGIAHEIQNPLNFVNNFSEVSVELLEELKEEAEAGNKEDVLAIANDLTLNLQKINHHGKRADFIVKGMLQHSRTSTGERQLTDINVLADEFLKLSYHGLRAKDKNFNAELVTVFEEGLPKVNVVQQDIGRVLLNLFNNAFYAVNEKKKTAGADYKPEVAVSTSTQGDCLIVKVKDNGPGIPDSIKDKIMQPFFTTKPTGEGTGLGLSLSYDIVVKGHGGKIEMGSREGDYTEFKIYIPATS